MDVRDARRTFTQKLKAIEDRGGRHVFFYIEYNGERYKGPKLSHGWKGKLGDQQIDWLKRPLFLSKREFEELVDCTLTGEQFYELWADRKGLPRLLS